MGNGPDRRPDQLTAVQRQAGHQVEYGQDGIRPKQVRAEDFYILVVGPDQVEIDEEGRSDDQVDARPDYRYQGFGSGPVRRFGQMGHTTEEPQGDALHGYSIKLRYKAVGQLVEQYGCEEQHRVKARHGPYRDRGPVRVLVG